MIREIRKPQDNKIIVEIPQEYVGQEIEVLVFPVNVSLDRVTPAASSFNAISLTTKDMHVSRDEANER